MPEFRIMDANWPFDPTVSITATSSDSEFPVSNLAKHHRSETWRSSGYFVITSSNNKLDFKEDSGGSQITYTIPAGNYSASELATMIKANMEALSTIGATYTVGLSASVTGKWTIATDGAYLSFLWNTGTNTANSLGPTIGFSSTADSTGALTYTSDYVAIHTEERVVFDLGTWSGQTVDSFAMVFDPSEGPKFTGGAVLKLQASQTNSWASPSVDVTLSIDDDYDVITHFFSSDQTYRYWSVKIVDAQNPYGYVEIPKIVLSDSTQLTQLPNVGFVEKNTDTSRFMRSAYGQTYVDQYPAGRMFSFQYTVLTEADVETLQAIHRRVGGMVPIAIALDPTATTFDKDRFFCYGRFASELEITNTHYTYFDCAFTLVEEL